MWRISPCGAVSKSMRTDRCSAPSGNRFGRAVRGPVLAACLVTLLAAPSAGRGEGPCRQIDILGKAEAEKVIDGDYEGTAIDPQWNQKQVVREAEKLMPPLLCLAARRVAFVDQDLDANDGLAGRTDKDRPDLLQMSAGPGPGLASEPELDPSPQSGERPEEAVRRRDKVSVARATTVQAILHEAAHAADYLLELEGSGGPGPLDGLLIDTSRWTAAAERVARETVEKNRLHKGLREEWGRIHDEFVRAGLAAPHHGRGDAVRWSSEELLKGGFMSSYAGHDVADDIAETTAWALAGETMRWAMVDPVYGTEPEGPVMDHACAAMQALPGPSIPKTHAAVFTKVGFLQSLGFIDEATYRRCVGSLRIRTPGPGIFSYKSGELDRRYEGALEAKIGKREGSPGAITPYVFELSATGTAATSGEGEVPVVARLRLEVAPANADLEDASYPRGLYFVGLANPDSQFTISRTDNGKALVDVTDGVALVARASSELIEGSLFIRKYLNYSGGLLSAIAGPEPPPEPTSITFRIEGVSLPEPGPGSTDAGEPAGTSSSRR